MEYLAASHFLYLLYSTATNQTLSQESYQDSVSKNGNASAIILSGKNKVGSTAMLLIFLTFLDVYQLFFDLFSTFIDFY